MNEHDESKPTTDRLFSLSNLRERGWTLTMVNRLLGDPDKVKPNPISRSAAPMRLYAPARVAEIEATEMFEQWREKAAKRSATGKADALKRSQELLAAVETMPITVARRSDTAVIQEAKRSYEQRQEDQYDQYEPVRNDGTTRDQAFIRRITVNYIRHELTEYDRALEKLVNAPGAPEARARLRVRILAAIAAQYPKYKDECERQRKEREDQREEAKAFEAARRQRR